MNDPVILRDLLARVPVLPVLTVDDPEVAEPLALALLAGGLFVLEVTLRTPVALEVIRRMSKVEGVIVGAGTITRHQDFGETRAAGARFAVSPGSMPNLLTTARAVNMSFLPGVMTPTEAMTCRAAGFDTLKFYPATASGGVQWLETVRGPLPDLRFTANGGVDGSNFREFLAQPNVLCCGGSWVAPNDAIKAGDWSRITELARSTFAEV